jgi:AbrB family looped-hinge helix DNA binding protein
MGFETRISTKGQIVLPKALRDHLQWEDGRALEIIEHAGAITLRPKSAASNDEKTREILARIRARNTYRGPRISDEEMREIVQAEAVRRYERSA